MKRALSALFEPLRPRTLAGQIVLFVAVMLAIVQLAGFAVYYFNQRAQWLTVTAAPGVIRVLDALDPRDRAIPWLRLRGPRGVEISATPPPPQGENSPELARRAQELFVNAGLRPLDVRASIDERRTDERRRSGIVGRQRAEAQPRFRVQLSVRVASDRWYTVHTRSAPVARPLIKRLIAQTLMLYAAVLIPLLGFARRLAGPLYALTAATERVGTREGAPAVPVRGSDDVAQLIVAFNAMRERIRANLDEKDHMLGAIGHDLRTPLTALRVRVESVPDDADRERMIATIDDMRQMLDDILELARVGHDREPPQRVDLGALVEAVADDHIETGAPVMLAELPRALVKVHPRAIRRAVGNLIDNAVKYGGGAQVLLERGDGSVTVAIEDDGPGIAPERIEEMLQPFTRVESSRSRETGGAGLGLAIVRAIVAAEGGTLSLGNRPQGGLRATITLPAA